MAENLMHGKNIIVTGRTQGLGEAVARLLVGARVSEIIICGRNKDKGLKVQSDLTRGNTKCVFVPADLQYEEDYRNVIATGVREFGELHSLVNAAGVTNRGNIEGTTGPV